MKKIKFIFIFILLYTVSCQSSYENHFSKDSIESKIERIIIIKETQTIAFIISFINKTNKNIVLSGNSISAIKYQDCGILMKNNDFVTPLGALIPDQGVLLLNTNDSVKYIFIYSRNYANKWKEFKEIESQKEMESFVLNSKFYYKSNKKEVEKKYQKFLSIENEPKQLRYVYDRDFQISNVNTPIEYKNSMTVDEILKFTEEK